MYLSLLGLVLDIAGAILLIKGEIQGGAALVRYWMTGQSPDSYRNRIQGFPWWKRWMLAAAGHFGSQEHLGEDWVEDSLPIKLWGIVLLIFGFIFQGLGVIFQW